MCLSQGRFSSAANPGSFDADSKVYSQGFEPARTGGGGLLLRTVFRTEGGRTVSLVTNFTIVNPAPRIFIFINKSFRYLIKLLAMAELMAGDGFTNYATSTDTYLVWHFSANF